MKIKLLNLQNKHDFQQWKTFLKNHGIYNFSPQEIEKIDHCFVWLNDQHEVIASGSIAGEILKYIAIDPNYQDEGKFFNQVISYLIEQAAQSGQYHLFVFTKPQYVVSFEHVGFNCLAMTNNGAVLESGMPDIHEYLQYLPQMPNAKQKQIAAIIMNANPFTKGHRYLAQIASQQNDAVYLFVVRQDASLFTYQERFELVKEGVADLKNVIVVSGGEYMVSYATFPAYFLKDDHQIGAYQAELDAELFKEQIAPALHITRRYLGSEPLSKTTESYNKALRRILPPEIQVRIIERKEYQQQIITATQVREAIQNDDWQTIQNFTVPTTAAFIKQNWTKLKQRINERR